MTTINGLVFDKDGTLFDFRKSWGGWVNMLLADVTGDAGLQARLAQAIGFDPVAGDFAPHSPVIAATAPEIAEAMLPHLPGQDGDALVAQMNRLAARAPMAEAVPLRPLLAGLRARGLRLGLATNDTELPARSHLRSHGIEADFEFVAGYDSGFGPKPAPGQLLGFVRATGLAPERVAMVGDSRHDMLAGRAAGMVCVAVLTGIASADELAPHADVVLPDIGAIPAWLDTRDAA